MGGYEVIWWVIAVCVCLCALMVLVTHIEPRSHIRDMHIERKEEERAREQGKLPYDYAPHTKKRKR